jgi:uncharacterized membrane protein YsdA (DUF1294 family)
MHNCIWSRLVALGFLTGILTAFPSLLAARPHERHRPNAEPKIHHEFTGCGRTELLARKDALDAACIWLKQGEYNGLDWSPDPDYLLEHKMVRFCEPEDKEFEVVKDFTKDGKLKVVKMQLDITADQDRDIQKKAQQQRIKERQKWAFLVLIGAMGVLGVVGGYLRLEEATKGYYTYLLRIAAISVLAVIVASLCIVG